MSSPGMERKFWINHANLTPRPLIMAANFLGPRLLTHLLENKSETAVRDKKSHLITPIQGAAASLMVPIVFPCFVSGMPTWHNNRHAIDPLRPTEPPMVMLSALIQPDFEFDSVTMEAIRLEDVPVEGEKVPQDISDRSMKRMLVYHLTKSHRLPAASSDLVLGSQFFELKGKLLSMEMLRNMVLIQLRLEQIGLDIKAQQFGINFLYTWDPPAIFARQIGQKVLDDLFVESIPQVLSKHVTALAFNDYNNKTAIPRLKKAMPNLKILAKSDIGDLEPGQFKVLHNNSDAFGKHILTQPVESSLDGALGSISSAAASLLFRKPQVHWVECDISNT